MQGKEMNETNPAMNDCFSGTALKEIVNRLQNELLKEDEKLGTLITTEDDGYGVWVTKDGYVLCIDKSKYYSSGYEFARNDNCFDVIDGKYIKFKNNESIIKEYQDRDVENCNLENDIASFMKKMIKENGMIARMLFTAFSSVMNWRICLSIRKSSFLKI